MLYPHFSLDQLVPLFPALALLLAAVCWFEFTPRKKTAIVLLILGSIALNLFVALLDPFLNPWDELYHALVAKNLTQNPLYPALFAEPLLPYDFKNWTDNHIWVHKQPLFLWQLASSIALFGANELAVRLPSILMKALVAFFIYRIGKKTLDGTTGFYAALLFATAYYPLEVMVGKLPTDHNDIAFLFYVTASMWAWIEHAYQPNKKWIIAIGLFAGAAVLVKWLLGLLVFPIWGLTILLDPEKRTDLKSYKQIAFSGGIAAVCFLPWQFYIRWRFPAESGFEMDYNSRHLFEVIEGHGGTNRFHWDGLEAIYGHGDVVPFVILVALALLWWTVKRSDTRIMLVGSVLFIYSLFTIAATKMVGYCLVVSPIIFLALANLFKQGFDWLMEKIPNNLSWAHRLLLPTVFLVLSFHLLSLERLESKHTLAKPWSNENRAEIMERYSHMPAIKASLDGGNYVLLNTGKHYNIAFMFYYDITAYRHLPALSEINTLLESGHQVAIFESPDIPEFWKEDARIKWLKWPEKKEK